MRWIKVLKISETSIAIARKRACRVMAGKYSNAPAAGLDRNCSGTAFLRGKMLVIGFGMSKIEYMFSRLMAFDAELIGSWGCLPKYYKDVLNMVLDGKIKLEPFVDVRPMSQIEKAFERISCRHADRNVSFLNQILDNTSVKNISSTIRGPFFGGPLILMKEMPFNSNKEN